MSTNQTTAAASPPQTQESQMSEQQKSELDKVFIGHIKDILQQIVQRFPENKQAATVLSQLSLLELQPALKRVFREQWRDFTVDHRDAIMNQQTEVVVKLFDDSPYEQLKMIGIHSLLVDNSVEQETKNSVWEYTKVLTVISHMGSPTQINKPQVQKQQEEQKPKPIAPPTFTQQVPPAVAAPTATGTAAGKKTNMKEAMKTILDSMPKFVETFNEVMKDNNGDNTFAQLANQFLNPNQLQAGVAPNLMANLMQQQGEAPSVMQQVQDQLGQPGLSADDIVKKLERLEKIEAIRNKRKK